MSKELIKNYQLEVAAAMKQAAEDYIADNPTSKVAKDTTEYLEASREDILLNLLGFERDSWGNGKFKVDHCNGRAGESAVGDYLRRVQAKAINDWLDSADLGEIDDDIQNALRKEFNNAYLGRLKQLVVTKARAHAEDQFKELEQLDALGTLNQMDSLLDTP